MTFDRWFCRGAVLLTLAFVLCASFFEILSPDLYFHLRVGEDLLRHGLSPFVDHYSFTFNGAPITNIAWPFEAISALFTDIFGIPFGVDVMRLVLFLGAFSILMRLLKGVSGVVTALVLMFFSCVLLLHSEPRPDVGSYIPELLSIWLITRLSERFQWRDVVLFALLLALWTNYHVSSVFGFVIAGAWLIEATVFKLLKRSKLSWVELVGAGVLLVGAGFLTHDQHPLLAQAKVGENWAKYITEYESRTFLQSEFFIEAFLVILCGALAYHLKQLRLAAAIIIAVLGFRTWSLSKLFPHMIVINLLFVAMAFEALRRWGEARGQKLAAYAAIGVLALAIGAQAVTLAFIKPVHPLNGKIDTDYFSGELTEYIKSHAIHGNVINEYGDGGFLLYTQAPELKVFIDGRTSILYPIEHMELYQQMVADPKVLADQSEHFKADYVIARAGKDLLESALKSRMYAFEYMEAKWALLGRQGKYVAATALLTDARCLTSVSPERLAEENRLAQIELPESSPVKVALNLATSATPQSIAAVDARTQSLKAEAIARSGDKAQALQLLTAKAPMGNRDVFRAIDWECEINGCARAEQILNQMSGNLTAADFGHALDRIDKISRVVPLQLFPPDRVARIRAARDSHIKLGQAPDDPDYCVQLAR